MKKILVGLIGAALTSTLFAASHPKNYKDDLALHSPFYIGIFGGYGVVDGAYKQDGQVTQGRLTFGVEAFQFKRIVTGLELGFQSGNTMRLSVDSALVDATGELEWQSILKPFVDFLIATKIKLSETMPVYVILNAGIAYRQLQLIDRNSSSDSLKKINPEAQVGLGFNITKNAILTVFYQGIYSTSSVGAGINSVGDSTISHIPTQQSGFIGIEYLL